MDAQRVTGYSASGDLCSYCDRRYGKWEFRQNPDTSVACLRFQEDHLYDQGIFSIRDVGHIRFRVFVTSDGGYTDEVIMEKLKAMLDSPINGN